MHTNEADRLRDAVLDTAALGADGIRCCGEHGTPAGASAPALSRRTLLQGLAAGVGVAAMPRAVPAAGRPLRIGVIPSDHYAALYVAIEKKMFEEAGFTPEVRNFPGGPPMLEGFVANQLDMGYVGPPGRIAVARGLPVKVVTGIAREGSSIIARPEIKRLADLIGKRVAVPVRGTIAHILLLVALDRAKIDAKDVTIIEIRDPEGLRLSLERGDVQAISVWEPWATQIEQAKVGHMLAEGGKVWPGYQCDSLIASTAYLGQRDLVRAVVGVHLKATKFVVDQPADTIGIVARAIKTTPEVERVALGRNIFTPVLSAETIAEEFALYKRLQILKGDDRSAFDQLVDQDAYQASVAQWRALGGKV